MATIKSFTDLQQSRKLVKILPLESADMYYILMPDGVYNHFPLNGMKSELAENTDIPCWSLAALLKTLNFPSLTQNKEDEWEVCVFDHDNDDYIEKTASNPVDACVEMIIKLNEVNLLW